MRPGDTDRQAALRREVARRVVGEAALALDPWFVPVDDAIVGLVDEVRNYSKKDLA